MSSPAFGSWNSREPSELSPDVVRLLLWLDLRWRWQRSKAARGAMQCAASREGVDITQDARVPRCRLSARLMLFRAPTRHGPRRCRSRRRNVAGLVLGAVLLRRFRRTMTLTTAAARLAGRGQAPRHARLGGRRGLLPRRLGAHRGRGPRGAGAPAPLLRPPALCARAPRGPGGRPTRLLPAQASARRAERAGAHPARADRQARRPHPTPRQHRHRYHGVLAPNSPLRAAVTALAPEPHSATARQDPAPTPTPAPPDSAPLSRSPARYLWAALIARIYATWPLLCGACGAELRLVAFITAPEPIDRILKAIIGPTGRRGSRPPAAHRNRPMRGPNRARSGTSSRSRPRNSSSISASAGRARTGPTAGCGSSMASRPPKLPQLDNRRHLGEFFSRSPH
jgi:hypothetical protein